MSDDDGYMDRNEFIDYAKKSHAVKVSATSDGGAALSQIHPARRSWLKYTVVAEFA